MRWTFLSVGRLRPPYADDIEHYQGLLRRYATVELIEVREDAQLSRRIPERSFVSLLADRGEQMDSMAFSRWVQTRREAAVDVCFVIGGAFGLDLPDADHRLSLGALTMPHQLARVVLLEQLYRAHRILAGEPYHH
ncbi:MAG: rRNA (pseudouridine1915-N3)-methyltransferase [Solirubrobacteraceae bacterium]|jgi:23S rRNA (pseudouridine1915-N3)-methyltransferase|nr:rRNA (pseudouridine1915-N3)-methyltransferase [Solirubrobacteraceae bacterium]